MQFLNSQKMLSVVSNSLQVCAGGLRAGVGVGDGGLWNYRVEKWAVTQLLPPQPMFTFVLSWVRITASG